MVYLLLLNMNFLFLHSSFSLDDKRYDPKSMSLPDTSIKSNTIEVFHLANIVELNFAFLK